MDNQQGSTVLNRELCAVTWQPEEEGSLEENGYMYMYGWVLLLSIWNYHNIVNWLSVQSLSRVWLFATAAWQAFLSIPNSQSLLKLMCIESRMPSNHLIFCYPLLLLLSIFSSSRVFPNESVLHISWPKYWSFSFNISPSNEYSGLISFRIDWFDLAVQGTLKSLQHYSSKTSILWLSAFFIVYSQIHTWLLEKP